MARYREGVFTVYGADQGLSSDHVNCLLRDRDENLWVGTRGGGLNRLRDGRFQAFTSTQGFSNDHVEAIFEDREGSLWVGTRGGLDRFTNGTVVTYATEEGLSNDMVWPILEDRKGALWVGTWKGLNRLSGGVFQTFTRKEGLPADAIFSLLEDRTGDLWVGTYGGGLARMSGGTFSTYTVAHGLPENTVWALFEDSAGAIWIGTNGGGLGRYREGRFRTYTTTDGLSENIVLAIHEDRRGVLWVGTRTKGLNRFEGGGFTQVRKEDGLPSDEVRCIHEEEDGSLWVGTREGLARLRDGAVHAVRPQEGLPARIIYWILSDDQGSFWMSSGRGIIRVAISQLNEVADGRRERLEAVLFGESDGMKSAECNGGTQPSGWRASDGRLWFTTARGAVVVDPAVDYSNPLPPPVHIEKVVVNDEVLDRWSLNGEELTFGPGLDRLEIHYSGLSLAAPERNRFRYRLEGFDEDWVEAGTRRVAYYTSLPPGSFRFRVRASNNDGVWDEAHVRLAFRIRPFFHETFPFYGLFALVFFLLGAGLLFLRIRRLRRQQEVLENLVAERTAELAEAHVELKRAYTRLQDTNVMLEDTNTQLEELATSDALTSVANRRRFDEVLESEWKRLARHSRPLSLVLLDVDHFKPYNDTYGHPGGDECLRRIAVVLQGAAHRSEDLVARYGGEEFALLLPETPMEGAGELAEGVRQAVEDLQMQHSGSPTASVVTISAGVGTATPTVHGNPQQLIELADRALYRAKEEGRNRIVCTHSSTP